MTLLTGYSKNTVARELALNTFLQCVVLKKNKPIFDVQQRFHIDTFYPSFKFWYYPHHVS